MGFEMFTKNEAAKLAPISVRKLEQELQRGTGPDVTRIGHRVLVRSDRLADWLDRHTVRPVAQQAA